MCNANEDSVILHEIEILDRIEVISETINKRFIPLFDSIRAEAEEVYENSYSTLAESYDPDGDFPEQGFAHEQALRDEAYNYHIQHEMKLEFINNTVTWLFHLFEKDCLMVFGTNDGNKKTSILSELGIAVDSSSSWFKCNTELRLLANVIKHGKGRSLEQLEKLNLDIGKHKYGLIANSEVVVSLELLNKYIVEMEFFWGNYFEQSALLNFDVSLEDGASL
ncbi:hypothetical protein [Vibrio atypicus]|uniref:hypothetical protein n=1 Tax=Vibrio atypicus TaxID=558271 RepID=UPI001358250F|nr:hypothetical protein [Vibrio atypicus]